jgi:hypothetical protein
LNDSIEKIASAHGLNREQMNRVVEATNTEVYVQMFNQAQDKYIQFQSADSEKIAENLFGSEKVSHVSDNDYQVPPTPVLSSVEDMEAEEAALTKVAEVKPDNTTNTEALHEYYKIAALETRLEQSIDEVEMKYQHDASILYSMVKQAVLSGTSFGDIERALTSVYDDQVIKINVQEIHTKLAEEMYPRKFDVVAHSVGTVNLENPLVKQASLLLKHAQDFKNLKSKHAETMEHLKHHIKESGILSPLKAMVHNPGAAAAGAGIGIVGGGVAVDRLAKKRSEQNTVKGSMQSLPNAYVR